MSNYTSHLHNLFKFLHEGMLRFMSPQSRDVGSTKIIFQGLIRPG